ncbi:MAG: hypothetical protein M1834_003036 [Cirrosporium novae-zelandiae]|nr:MAG: hypothetical protein M1834_003036 [Cirrosporium novae-zelandiae]
MNCPSRVDEVSNHPGWNQNPSQLSSDMTTNSDLNGITNSRLQRNHRLEGDRSDDLEHKPENIPMQAETAKEASKDLPMPSEQQEKSIPDTKIKPVSSQQSGSTSHNGSTIIGLVARCGRKLAKFGSFIGPGFLISVAYIDPGNYATDIGAGAATRFHLLFIILLSNIIAIFLQTLCIKLGTVTGMNLAENCRAHLPNWLNLLLYGLAEIAIVATDMAEVIGSAISLNLLIKIPLVWGCALTIVDVMLILLLYDPNGSMRKVRMFEYFVVLLVVAVVICFCFQLSLIEDTSVGEVFEGYLPSKAIFEDNGLYLSCGILGATVMAHSLYLGSGLVQPRLREFDIAAGNVQRSDFEGDDLASFEKYRPSIQAIRACLNYSVVELALELFVFALFINSSILIVAGSSLSNTDASDADLFGIYHLLAKYLSPIAATVFALSLLFSGMSAGIVATIAGQMLMEGAIHWTMKPWVRRVITRSISIIPSIIIAGSIGRSGLNAALNASQVILSVLLPFLSAPIIYFTSRAHIMTVSPDRLPTSDLQAVEVEGVSRGGVNMRNHWVTVVIGVIVWILLAVMNVGLLVMVGMGYASDGFKLTKREMFTTTATSTTMLRTMTMYGNAT